MIKARIRWCTCRVENILTLGKLLSLWFCFLLHSILFLISQTSYRTYKIISSYELARPVMGTIFLVTSIPEETSPSFIRSLLKDPLSHHPGRLSPLVNIQIRPCFVFLTCAPLLNFFAPSDLLIMSQFFLSVRP